MRFFRDSDAAMKWIVVLGVLFSLYVLLPIRFTSSDITGVLLSRAMQVLIIGLVLRIVQLTVRKNVAKSTRVGGKGQSIGLSDVAKDFGSYDLGDVILNARRLTVVLNDGRTWASFHQDALRKRFTDPNKQTTIFLCHPDSPMLPILARKGSIDESALRNRILDTIQFVQHLAEGGNKQLEILGHFLFNPSSLVLSESVAVVTPYMFSRGLKSVPVLVFRDTGPECFYRSLVEDMERLRMDAKAIFLPPAKNYVEETPLTKIN